MEFKTYLKRHRSVIVIVLLLLAITFGCLGLVVHNLGTLFFVDPESVAARATESALTAAHGIEARLAIQAFIDTNWSFAAFRDPLLLSKVATGKNLEALQALRRVWSSNKLDIIRSSTINKVQVIDYSPAQFKAFSCEVLNFDTVTTDGTYVSSMKPFTAFRIYVFNYEDGGWKVAAWADFTDADHIYRDWQYVPQWEKDLIGYLPSLIDKYDTCFSL